MAIVRSPRPVGRYVVLDKAISEDGRLSWAARGLLVYLLGKPDNWSVRVAHLIAQTMGARIATGRDGVYSLLGELIEAGYVERREQARDGGAFGEATYVVYDSPCTAEPDTAGPHTAAAHTAEPEPSKEVKATSPDKTKDGSKAKRAEPREVFAPPAWVPAEPWGEFVEARKKLRKPMTDGAMRLAVRELEKLRGQGHDPAAVLQQSVLRGWLGLFPVTVVTRDQQQRGGDVMDRVRRSADEFAAGGAA